MPKTVVGLFEHPGVVEEVVSEIEVLGLARREIRTLEEPLTFDYRGVMSFPRLDFEVHLVRELIRIGANHAEAEAYTEGLRRGGALVLATGSDEDVETAAEVMKRHGAVEIEQASGSEPHLPHGVHESLTPASNPPVMAGRIRQAGGGIFVW